MIDLNLFRFRVGVFNNSKKRGSSSSSVSMVSITGNLGTDTRFLNISKLVVYLFLYLYYALCVLGMVAGMLVECKLKTFSLTRFHDVRDINHSHHCFSNVKLFSAILICFLVRRDLIFYNFFGFFFGIINKMSFRNHCFLNYKQTKSSVLFRITDKMKTIVTGCLLWLLTLNSILIVLCNPSILNPGPLSSVTVTSFNVQGLLPISQLDCENPTLDVTKICELNYYLTNERPDILMLNETWLKKSVSDNEIFPANDYKIFRLDRTPKTHPPDPNNSSKYRKNGGGVLIAVRRDLDIVSTKLEFSCAAEVLGITLKFSDGKKLILCSYYRVGNLSAKNHSEFSEYIRKARCRRGVVGIIVAGDLNFPRINWEEFSSTEVVDRLFLDTFSNFGIQQLVNSPTHYKGNILDLVLTDKPQLIFDLNVLNSNLPCKSDHYSVSFKIRSRCKRIKASKRDAYNYKRADWAALNSSFGAVDWESELAGDIETAWGSFNQIFFSIVNQHIPKIKIGGQSQPPWFDAEAHQLCRKKERLHTEYKNTKEPELRTKRYLKFSTCRRKFKDLVETKMGSSFEDNDDPNLITKKFWSYVKATSRNTRIPEMIHNEGIFKTKPIEQSVMFNSFFYQQFSEQSNYDTPVEIDPNDNQFNIDFDCQRVFSILSKLNASKAVGPDKIHGKVLKTCAYALSIPLSILFKKSYYTSSLPSDWKLAHIVPVHKKGSKSEVQNYRPISLTSLVVKVMERIVRDELMSKCEYMLDPRQHGFLPNKSCATQLVEFCDSLSLSLNKNIRSDVIYFDFAKAFDSVSHDIILQKLKTIYKINGYMLAFISNYLSGRWQQVVVNGSVSDRLPVLSGVPQGSILGPSLFVLFINDMTFGLNEDTNIMLYADDTKIWREMVVEEDYKILQKDIDYLLDWATQNKMRFHPSKCKVLTVSLFRPH